MYQKLIIIGNLGRDPEMRYTPDGKAAPLPGNFEDPADEAEDIYVALYRVSKTSY